jgi:hypothetical protein
MTDQPQEFGFSSGSAFSDVSTRLRDLEEKTRLVKDRVLIMGKNLVEERESTFEIIQELKAEILSLKSENIKIKEALSNISTHLDKTARKEDFEIIKRQLDILRS